MYEAIDPEVLGPLGMSFIRTSRIVRRHVTGQAGFPLTASLPVCATPSQRSSNVPTRPDATAPTPRHQKSQRHQVPAKNARPQAHPTSRTPRTSDSPACKVNGNDSKTNLKPGGLSNRDSPSGIEPMRCQYVLAVRELGAHS